MIGVLLSALFLYTPYVLTMDKKVVKHPNKGHYDFRKVPQYYYRWAKPVTQDLQVVAQESCSLNNHKPLVSLIYEKESCLIIATAKLLSSDFQDVIVTVKKRTDIEWTNVYSIHHNVKKNSDYAISFLLEAYLKDKIAMLENSL